ncbi:histamine H2 receptor-like [Pomacea canaliculata]|uniref:histamine H2 receptor-like n=1 Tax=Pomacea canaliculata TaxID=400727 RepID=UPI000D73AE17|nr:histamine H2 receptor-like [Pomacea canaliculata]
MFGNATPPDSVARPLTGEKATLALVTVVLSLTAVVSNSLLVYVVVRTTTLHTSTNVFIASLSVAEFLTGLLVVPFVGAAAATAAASSPSASSSGWPFSSGACCFLAAMGVLGRCAASLSLLVVSADRCVAISRPLRYASIVTQRSTVVVLVVVWLQSLLMALLPLTRWGRYAYAEGFGMCLMRSSSGSDEESSTEGATGAGSEVLVKETLCTFAPAAAVLVLMAVTVHQIRGHRRVFAIVPIPVAATSLPAGTSSMVTAASSTFKAMRSLLLVILAFFVLGLPFAVACVLCQTGRKCSLPAPLLRSLLWLSFLGGIVNPILIMALNRKFRAALRALFFCGGCRILRAIKGLEKDPFALSTGLHTVMETTLVVNMIHGVCRRDANIWRQVVMNPSARPELLVPPAPRRVGILTLRKTRSSPECVNFGAVHM